MKRICCLLLGLMLCLGVPKARGEAPEPVENARHSLVQLYGLHLDSQTGRRTRWVGTGYAVGIQGEDSDIFLTNWHVVTGGGQFADDRVQLWILREGARFGDDTRPLEGCAVPCRVLITTDGYPDVAVVQAMEPVTGYPALSLLPTGNVPDGTRVYSLGFPGLRSLDASGAEDVCITSGIIREHLTMSSAGDTGAVIHTASIQPGFSGGPVLNEAGAVVAQNTYGFQPEVSTELFCAVDTEYGMALLDRLNIPYTSARGSAGLTVCLAALFRRPGVRFALAAVFIGVALLLGKAARKEEAYED